MSTLTQRVQQLLPEATVHYEAEDDRALTLFGPPGTGKTTSMLKLIDAHLEAGSVDPDRLAVFTFTRNAQAEALERAQATTGIDSDDWPWIRTLHSACYRLLQLRPGQVMQPQHWKMFSSEYPLYQFTFTTERDEDDPLGGAMVRTFGDWCRTAEELRRARMWSIEEAVEQLGRMVPAFATHWDVLPATTFSHDLADWKQDMGLLDFSDMLEMVLREHLRPPATHFFIDEAQDLSRLQWAVVDSWTQQARRSFVFGDDDQAIFEWSGADPHALMERPGHQLVLARTWRLPENVHAAADRIVQRVQTRIPKRFEPVGPGGDVARLWKWDDVELGEGTALLLARNRMHLDEVRDWLIRTATPYTDRANGSGVPAIGSPRSQALLTALELSGGGIINSRAQLRNLRRHVWPELWPEDRIPKTPMARTARLAEFGATEGLLRSLSNDPLGALKLGSRKARLYLSRLINVRGTDVLRKPPRVELSTIHGVKGEEADQVFVATGMSAATHAGFQANPDAEHRVFYVAASRAKRSLRWVVSGGQSYEP